MLLFDGNLPGQKSDNQTFFDIHKIDKVKAALIYILIFI